MFHVGEFQADDVAGENCPGRCGHHAGPVVPCILRVIKGATGSPRPNVYGGSDHGTKDGKRVLLNFSSGSASGTLHTRRSREVHGIRVQVYNLPGSALIERSLETARRVDGPAGDGGVRSQYWAA